MQRQLFKDSRSFWFVPRDRVRWRCWLIAVALLRALLRRRLHYVEATEKYRFYKFASCEQNI